MDPFLNSSEEGGGYNKAGKRLDKRHYSILVLPLTRFIRVWVTKQFYTIIWYPVNCCPQWEVSFLMSTHRGIERAIKETTSGA